VTDVAIAPTDGGLDPHAPAAVPPGIDEPITSAPPRKGLPPGVGQIIGLAGSTVVLLVATQLLYEGTQGGGKGTPAAILFQGLVAGALNAMTAAGMVLLYRSIRIINFAAAAVGAAGSIFAVYMTGYNPGFPFPLTFILSLLLGGAAGALIDVCFGRRFARAPRLVLTVVTISGSGLLFIYSASFLVRLPFFPRLEDQTTGDLAPDRLRRLLPFPGYHFEVGSFPLKFGFPEVLALEVAAVALIAVGLFVRYTRIGTAVRASAENSERASLLGISTGQIGMIVWIVAGMLSAATGALTAYASNPGGINPRGPEFLFPALAAAVIAKFRNLPVAIYTSLLIGIFAAATTFTFRGGTAEVVIYGVLLVVTVGGLIVQRRDLFRLESSSGSSWQASEEPRPIPKELLTVTGLKVARYLLVFFALAAVLAVPFLFPTRIQVLGAVILINTIAALSLVVLTGWSGQVSLGQYGFVAVGALASGQMVTHHISWYLAIPAATIATALVAFLLGLPALRIRGLFLAGATFGFGAFMAAFMASPRFGGRYMKVGLSRPNLVFIDFEEERSMYYLAAAALVVSILVLVNLRKSRFGRLLIAIRENEANVQSFGVKVLRSKLYSFGLAGGLAGFSGALLELQARGMQGNAFGVEQSINLFITTILGGVAAPAGALIGSAYANLTAYFLGGNLIFSFILPALPLLLLYIAPGGMLALALMLRDSVLRIVAQRRQIVVPSLFADFDIEALEHKLVPLSEASMTDGLALLPTDQRYALASDYYAGHGTRIFGRLAEGRANAEADALAAAAAVQDDQPLALAAASSATGDEA
jgi:branched-chain amino acid transport system permease protein